MWWMVVKCDSLSFSIEHCKDNIHDGGKLNYQDCL